MNNNYHAMIKFIQKQVVRTAAALLCAGMAVSASAQAPAFSNNSFETPVLSSNYAALPGNVGWTVVGTAYQMQNSFIGSNYGVAASPSGNQVVWVQVSSSIRQNVTVPAGNHAITFRVAQPSLSSYLRIVFNGTQIGIVQPHLAETSQWHEYTVFTGSVAAGTYQVQFNAMDSSGAGSFVLLDDIRIVTDQQQAAQLLNPGFEAPEVSPGSYQIGMSGTSWSGSGNAGIFSNAYSFVGGGGAEGAQIAGLASGNYILQSLTLQPGTYSIAFKAAAANDGLGTFPPFAVFLNTTLLHSATASDYTLRAHTTPNITVNSAGTYTVRMQNTGSGGWLLLDAVEIRRLVLPPVVMLTGLTEGGNYTAPVQLSATASAPQGLISKVDFYANGTLVGTVYTGASGQAGNNYTFSWQPSTGGSFAITAKATMADGAHATTGATTISVPAYEVYPSEIDWVGPLPETYTAPASVLLKVKQVSVHHSSTVQSVKFRQGTTVLQEVVRGGPGNSGDEFEYLWQNVGAGNYVVTAEPVGYQCCGPTIARSWVVLSPATVTLTSPAAGSTYTSGASITLTATASQVGGTISKVEFLSGATVIGTVMTGASGNTGSTYSFTWTAPNPGASAANYVISARSTDGNQATATSATASITVNPVVATTGIYYVHSDHLGTPRQITRPSDNQTVWKWDNSDAFGANAANDNPSGLGIFAYNLRFPGQYADAETNTNYNYFRDYEPATGRYRQSDPIGLLGGISTYAYVSGNPLYFIDRFGLCEQPVWRGGYILGWKPCPGYEPLPEPPLPKPASQSETCAPPPEKRIISYPPVDDSPPDWNNFFPDHLRIKPMGPCVKKVAEDFLMVKVIEEATTHTLEHAGKALAAGALKKAVGLYEAYKVPNKLATCYLPGGR